jgi:UDP-N-acetyl-D-mannosaminuronic acid dehydrogenase
MKKACVLGLGYIGLPTSIIAAKNGFDVIGFDIDVERVTRINAYDPVIEEPDLLEALKEVLEAKAFHATSSIDCAEFFIIAVPTPFKKNKDADLSYVWKAAESISEVLKKNDIIILESTVPVGTTDDLANFLAEKTGFKAGIDFYVAHCPERVLPGNIFYELVHNARIIGGINELSLGKAKEFYKSFVKGPLYLTNATTAEMVKLVENSSRDVAIAFANQVASMAYRIGLNPFEVIELANKHPRVSILNPSCGVGGHCIAVDPWFLIQSFPEQSMLLQSARDINDSKPKQVIDATMRCVSEWGKMHKGTCKVLVLGLTYKPDIDDLRESPALRIAKELSEKNNIDLSICEPHIKNIKKIFGKEGVWLVPAVKDADVIVCLVHHKHFQKLSALNLENKKVLDFCGLFYKAHLDETGQEKLFWPASNAAISSIIEHVQKEL